MSPKILGQFSRFSVGLYVHMVLLKQHLSELSTPRDAPSPTDPDHPAAREK